MCGFELLVCSLLHLLLLCWRLQAVVSRWVKHLTYLVLCVVPWSVVCWDYGQSMCIVELCFTIACIVMLIHMRFAVDWYMVFKVMPSLYGEFTLGGLAWPLIQCGDQNCTPLSCLKYCEVHTGHLRSQNVITVCQAVTALDVWKSGHPSNAIQHSTLMLLVACVFCIYYSYHMHETDWMDCVAHNVADVAVAACMSWHIMCVLISKCEAHFTKCICAHLHLSYGTCNPFLFCARSSQLGLVMSHH